MKEVKATAGTGAITDGNQVAFSLRGKHFKHGNPIVSIEGLATTETVSFYILTNGDWEELSSADATQHVFTATYAADTFNSPGTYGFIKDATAAAITLSVNYGQ